VTCVAECGRYEAGSGADVARRRSYKVREVAVVANERITSQFCEEWLQTLAALAEKSGLPARLQSASDPFFGVATSELLTYQRRLRTKYELVGIDASEQTVALSSVNRHGAHFGTGFNIKHQGSVASSACVGFGLDRWAAWIVSHCGLEPDQWPALLLELPS
jgi:hypothetical protein